MKMKNPFASLRLTRTTVKLPEVAPIRQSHSNPDRLKKVFSDESSIFSGLGDQSQGPGVDLEAAHTIESNHSESDEHNQQDGYERFVEPMHRPIDHEDLHARNQQVFVNGKCRSNPTHHSRGFSSGDRSPDATESTLTDDRSQRSFLREMPPMVDSDTAFAETSDPSSRITSKPTTEETMTAALSCDPSNIEPWPMQSPSGPSCESSTKELIASAANHFVDERLFRDEDTNTLMTWGSAHEMPRPKGTVKLVSQLTFFGEQKQEKQLKEEHSELQPNVAEQEGKQKVELEYRQPAESTCGDDASGSRIVEMLTDFERQMDANLKIIQDEEKDEKNDFLCELQDVVPRRVMSEDDTTHRLTPYKARELERRLHEVTKEVEVLRDNNEQFKAEIEQMEEEHKSELKLIEDRTKQKIAELKHIYQEEIGSLSREKDAAIVEASKQASLHVESGKKQVAYMKKQLERLKATATSKIQEKVEEAGRLAIAEKDKEITARLGALRKSYESQLEAVRSECDERVKAEVENALSAVAKRVRLNQDVQIREMQEQIDNLQIERRSMQSILASVKSNLEKHYARDLKAYRGKTSKDFYGGSRKFLEDDDPVSSRTVERELKEVIEIFAFLLECAENDAVPLLKQSSTEEESRERHEVYNQMRKEMQLRHRAEIVNLKKSQVEAQEKIRKFEERCKILEREKHYFQEKHQRAYESHRLELEKLRNEHTAALEFEQSRRSLAAALATGQRELSKQQTKCATPKIGNGKSQTTQSRDLCPLPSPPSKSTAATSLRVDQSDLQRSDHERSDHQRSYIESPSTRRARAFLYSMQTSPRCSPRYSARQPMQPSEKSDGASESSLKSSDYFFPERAIEKVDAFTVVVNAGDEAMGDAGNTSAIGNVKKLVPDAVTANLMRKESNKVELSGETSETEPSARRRRSFAILRSFKANKDPRCDDMEHDTATDCHESESKIEPNNSMSRSIRRARIIKGIFDHGVKQSDDSYRSCASIDGNISSLQAKTGVATVASKDSSDHNQRRSFHGRTPTLESKPVTTILEEEDRDNLALRESSSHMNLSKSPVRAFQGPSVRSASPCKGKKKTNDEVDSIFTMKKSSDDASDGENNVPRTIAVRSPSRERHSAVSDKGPTPRTQARGKTEARDEDNGYPKSQDKYQSLESPKIGNIGRIPLVASRSVDNSSADEKKMAKYRPSGRPQSTCLQVRSLTNEASAKDLSGRTNKTGGTISRATTPDAGRTSNTANHNHINSVPFPDSNNIISNSGMYSGPVRFAALKARVRVRKDQEGAQ